MEDVSLYNIRDDGEYEQMPITGQIKDMLNSKMVALIVSDRHKKIWLWKGTQASVRKKFIGARKSQDLRGERGLSYKVESIDHGSEPQDFISVIGGVVPAAPEPAEDIQEFIPGGAASIPEPAAAAPAQKLPPSPPSFASPQPQPQPQPARAAPSTPPQPAAATYIDPQIQSLNVEESVKKILARVQQYPIPEGGYTRELICIGPYVFSQIEQKKAFLGNEQIKYAFELMESLPEGEFLAKGYIPRLIINEGRILAIELLKTPEMDDSTSITAFKIKYLWK
ncbi:MAG: actin depolymerization factor/cofilin- and gelsolin-like domain-containing protein [Candidatus Helarchaeales archaeon]